MCEKQRFTGNLERERMDEEANNTNAEEEVLGSSLTLEKVVAAKQFIENHYRNQMKSIHERKERCVYGAYTSNEL